METGPSVPEGLDLRGIIQVARRRWMIILALVVLIPILSVLISLRREPRYAASSEVLIKRQNLAATLTPGEAPYTDAQTAERVIETQVQLARVPDLADQVIAAAGLVGQATAIDLLDSSRVTPRTKSDIVVFTVEWTTPEDARTLANLYARLFTTYRRQIDETELNALADSVRSQLAAIDAAAGGGTPLSIDLEEKLRQIQTLQALQTSSAVVVREADTAARVGATPTTMGAGGFLLGLMLAAGIAFLLESLDTRVRRSSEVAAILGLPLLARIPDPPGSFRRRSGLVVMERPESSEAEAFSFLRTNLTFAMVTSHAKVIMVCSAQEQEGKSTTVANLAVAFARFGSRVALVDLDHRRPTLHSFFSIPRSPGVIEVSRGSVELANAIHHVSVPTAAGVRPASGPGDGQSLLKVLPAGGTTHEIDIDDVVAVLDRLRDGVDIVLVDAPPLLRVGAALALSARMDAVILITRLNHVRRPMVEELRRSFEGTPVRALGFVATAANQEQGYAHYYGKAYGYTTDDRIPPAPQSRDPMPEAGPERLPTPEPTAAPQSIGERGRPARQALRDVVFADVRPPAGVGPEQDSRPSPGVQPRRSWAPDARAEQPSPAPGVAGEAVPGHVGSFSTNGTEGDEGTEG